MLFNITHHIFSLVYRNNKTNVKKVSHLPHSTRRSQCKGAWLPYPTPLPQIYSWKIPQNSVRCGGLHSISNLLSTTLSSMSTHPFGEAVLKDSRGSTRPPDERILTSVPLPDRWHGRKPEPPIRSQILACILVW